LPPKDSKEEEFIARSPTSSKLTKISDNELLWSLFVEIWMTTSLSLSRLADTDDKELYMVPFLWFSWWIKSSACLDNFDRSSSFLWISLSTCCWSFGMYSSTREIVCGMLNFFWKSIITKIKIKTLEYDVLLLKKNLWLCFIKTLLFELNFTKCFH